MFQFSGYSSIWLFIHHTVLEYCSSGFPHSDICGSMDICSSPQLFAACHVLLRLLMPRHSPCALFSLTFVEVNFVCLDDIASQSRLCLLRYFSSFVKNRVLFVHLPIFHELFKSISLKLFRFLCFCILSYPSPGFFFSSALTFSASDGSLLI